MYKEDTEAKEFVALAGGNNQTFALKSDGTVWAWGHGTVGTLGNGMSSNSYTPVQVSGLTDVTEIYAG